ncbi:unnamed protein product [Cylindrotheca closterium]|uniref:ABC transporter domain-containing protein n=1 Tax=Cylindrotheca closterium TaxID=2856 RepID=A0AAD2FZZ6_9STRA|nr:unnamed protein product [Cylindrotheca closterium]
MMMWRDSFWLFLLPFCLRAGVASCDELYPSGLYWNISVQSADGTFLVQPTAHFLFVPNGHICGVLGPSGAGKSTTLNALGGSIPPQSSLSVNGNITYYDATSETKTTGTINSGSVAWLQQHDSFFSMLTVKETLDMAAFLELPHLIESQRNARVQSIMESLGLTKLQDRPIGDPTTRHKGGLSGGEQRRVSLARELISNPKLFIGDEPTSGLDSTMSEKVIRLVQKMVQERDIPCLLSIHQPRSSIFRMLDEVLLLAPGGRVCYHGKSEKAIGYFRNLGYECPEETNPAEFLVDLVSIDVEDQSTSIQDEIRIIKLFEAFQEYQQKRRHKLSSMPPITAVAVEDCSTTSSRGSRRRFHIIRRFGRLLLRSWRQNARNRKVNILRLLASAGNAMLFTTIFKSIKKGVFTAKSVAERVSMLTFGIVNMSMIALLKTVDLFSKEKPVVQREQLRLQYSSLEYLFSKSIAEIPLDAAFAAVFTTVLKMTSGIRTGWRALTGTFALMTVAGASLGFAIGAASPSADVALSSSAMIMVVMMAVGIINPSGVDLSDPPPLLVRALKQISPINYAVKALCLSEYKDAEFGIDTGGKPVNIFSRARIMMRDLPKMGGLALVKNGNQVLQELGLADETYAGVMKQLGVLSLVNLAISLIGLQTKNSGLSQKC